MSPALLLILLSIAIPSSPNCTLIRHDDGPKGTAKLHVHVLARGLVVPWALAFLPDGDILVTERPGRIRLIHDGKLVARPVTKVDVETGGEGGLLGLALHPKFKVNRLFYIYGSFKENGRDVNRVERWRLSADHRSAAREKIILDGLPRAKFHDGGRMHFGPDGMLYISVGDGENPALAQDPNARNGKILRLTADGQVPSDNPNPQSPVFLRGVRNCEGFAWPNPSDPNLLWLVDHGPTGEIHGWHGSDEIDVAHAGENLGWPIIHRCASHAKMVSPILSWVHAVPPGGAAIYTGSQIPAWKGSLMVGSLGAKELLQVRISGPGKLLGNAVYLHGDPPAGFGRLRAVVMGPDGDLYLTTSNCDGRGHCPKDKDYILQITK